MKAISIRQPWASWIARGEYVSGVFRQKTIETRSWTTKHRGDLLIVSTKKPEWPHYPLGKALCIVSLVDCREMKASDEWDAMCSNTAHWPMPRYAWILENIRPIKPFPVKGQQRLYEVEIPDAV